MARYGPVSFFLDTEDKKDQVVIAWHKSLRERRLNQSQAIRDLLYKALGGPGVTLEDIERHLDTIETLLRSGAVATQPGAGDPVGDPDSDQAVMGKLPNF